MPKTVVTPADLNTTTGHLKIVSNLVEVDIASVLAAGTVSSATAPSPASLGLRWLDTSVTPNVFRTYTGGAWLQDTDLDATDTAAGSVRNATMAETAAGTVNGAVSISPKDLNDALSQTGVGTPNTLQTAIINATKATYRKEDGTGSGADLVFADRILTAGNAKYTVAAYNRLDRAASFAAGTWVDVEPSSLLSLSFLAHTVTTPEVFVTNAGLYEITGNVHIGSALATPATNGSLVLDLGLLVNTVLVGQDRHFDATPSGFGISASNYLSVTRTVQLAAGDKFKFQVRAVESGGVTGGTYTAIAFGSGLTIKKVG